MFWRTSMEDQEEKGPSGNNGLRQLTMSPHHVPPKKIQSWFRFLLLLSVALFFLCYVHSINSPSWWENSLLREHYQRLMNHTYQVQRPPSYRVHPKHLLKAYPRNYRFIMDVGDVCKNNTPFLVLMVPVSPGNVEARDAIRRTWGKENVVQGERVRTLFMLGLAGGAVQQQKVLQESKLHCDLIQSNFVDTYVNLTIKTMVIMEWLATRCPMATYAMKVDSDMFLNIDNLVLMLQRPGIPKTNYLTGMIMWDIPVIRQKSSKWYVPEELYPNPKYPTYTLGMGYVFSNDLPRKFVDISKTITPFNIEDAYIGMCMSKLGLAPTPPPDRWQFRTYNTKYNRCEYSRIITYILGSPQELVNYWMDLKSKPGPPC
ncbi:beta-1,3-galactosyltransferase 2-like isoform X2 [Dunckerocampus dactyliophorus]|uniref:beta-1,3-galactosyltransferase 2-like isoform X2 n=1 Tax=Dunckerocampus dactyliophorus TaxID=161453 RepID=UPI002406179C|nr:beta-1,3-galactosyltransferase 2-like isoform X2 [Dunckerocampus dactyliophorus]